MVTRLQRYGRQLGLSPYSVRQGLVEKLVDRAVVPGRDTVQVGGAFLDVPTSYKLWTQVYSGPNELIDSGTWFDQASYLTPYAYTVAGYLLADSLERRGQVTEATKILSEVKQMAKAARLKDVLAWLDKGG